MSNTDRTAADRDTYRRIRADLCKITGSTPAAFDKALAPLAAYYAKKYGRSVPNSSDWVSAAHEESSMVYEARFC